MMQLLFVALSVLASNVLALPVFDLSSCYNMCRDCPRHAACIPIFGNTQCGVCSCVIGFQPHTVNGMSQCVRAGAELSRNVDATEAPSTTTTTSRAPPTPSSRLPGVNRATWPKINPPTTTTSTQPPTTTTPKTQGEVRPSRLNRLVSTGTQSVSSSLDLHSEQPESTTTTPIEVTTTTTVDNVANEENTDAVVPTEAIDERLQEASDSAFICPNSQPQCAVRLPKTIEKDPMLVEEECINHSFEAVTCANGSECAPGTQCIWLDNEKTTSACVCEYGRSGTKCNIMKPHGKCTNGSSETLPTLTKLDHSRFVHKELAPDGAIYARHIVPNVEHCAKLCEWAGGFRCRSFNYGTINGQSLCELLSIGTDMDDLSNWLVEDANWTYYCCYEFKEN